MATPAKKLIGHAVIKNQKILPAHPLIQVFGTQNALKINALQKNVIVKIVAEDVPMKEIRDTGLVVTIQILIHNVPKKTL